jgi:hypothetical protein
MDDEFEIDQLEEFKNRAIKTIDPGRLVAAGIWSVRGKAATQVVSDTTPTMYIVTVYCLLGNVSVHHVHDNPSGGTSDTGVGANSSLSANCRYARVNSSHDGTSQGYYLIVKG